MSVAAVLLSFSLFRSASAESISPGFAVFDRPTSFRLLVSALLPANGASDCEQWSFQDTCSFAPMILLGTASAEPQAKHKIVMCRMTAKAAPSAPQRLQTPLSSEAAKRVHRRLCMPERKAMAAGGAQYSHRLCGQILGALRHSLRCKHKMTQKRLWSTRCHSFERQCLRQVATGLRRRTGNTSKCTCGARGA